MQIARHDNLVMKCRRRALAAIAILLTACTEGEMHDSVATAPPIGNISPASVEANLTSVAATHIYFGHQSVGANILAGLRELGTRGSGPRMSIVSTRDFGSVSTPALAEFTIGENGDPASKVSDFSAAIDALSPDATGIALFKYCYLDLTSRTDVAQLFAAHRASLRALQARHPGLIFVHVTAPLTTAEPASKALLKRVLGKPSSREANVKRNEFNALLRREFQGEPIFDLARIESSRPDGSRAFFTAGSDTVFTLAQELTDDGGHLNEAGRHAAAVELLSVLAAAARAPVLGRHTIKD